MSESWATVIAAIGGAIVTLVGTYVISVIPERNKSRTILADYLDGIAGSMKNMAEKFRSGQIPPKTAITSMLPWPISMRHRHRNS